MMARFRSDYAGTTRAFADQYMFVPTMDPKLREAVIADMASRPPDISVPMIEAAWRYDPRPALQALRIPICAVNADKYPTKLDALRGYAPQYQAVFVRGVGHYLMREDAPAFNARLAEALDAIEHAPAPRR
jgi:pimeloyl-ACP methyl ester carboxylesterase